MRVCGEIQYLRNIIPASAILELFHLCVSPSLFTVKTIIEDSRFNLAVLYSYDDET